MSKFILSFVLFVFIFLFDFQEVAGTEGEDLVDLINAWRRREGKSSIPKSRDLFKVANAHTTNQCVSSYKGRRQDCWNPHSWEDVDGYENFETCCYEPKRGSTFSCMWEKPEEIAGSRWRGINGYEVSAGGQDPQGALNAWKRSSGHTEVILSSGKWKYMNWKAIGCAGAPDRMRHWNCWFAKEDPGYSYRSQGEPKQCSGGHWGDDIWGDYSFTLEENEAPEIAPEDAKKGNAIENAEKNMIWWIIGGVVLLIVIAVIAYCVWSKKATKAKGVIVDDVEEEEVEDEEECVIQYTDGDHEAQTVTAE